jgi:hypothetical protein
MPGFVTGTAVLGEIYAYVEGKSHQNSGDYFNGGDIDPDKVCDECEVSHGFGRYLPPSRPKNESSNRLGCFVDLAPSRCLRRRCRARVLMPTRSAGLTRLALSLHRGVARHRPGDH